jgi:hypothetical protein
MFPTLRPEQIEQICHKCSAAKIQSEFIPTPVAGDPAAG